MLGDMKMTFDDAVKSTEPLQMPQVTPPSVIFATLEVIPDMSQTDKLRVYGKLILSERLFHAILKLSMEVRKEWLLILT
jgi:hypothetical protein